MTRYPEARESNWIWDSFPEPRTIPTGWDLSGDRDPGDVESHRFFDVPVWGAEIFAADD